jgi:hypothetical protein
MIRFTKLCAKCLTEKPLEEFRVDNHCADLCKAYCILCDDEYQATRYDTKKDNIKKNAINWQKKNPEKVKEYKAKYYQKQKAKKILNEQKSQKSP